MSLVLQIILSVVSKLPKPIRNAITPDIRIPHIANSPSKVQLAPPAHIYVDHPDRIFVTTEVTVTRDFGRLRPKMNRETKLHSTSSRWNLTLDQCHQSQDPQGWEPYVGDGTAGLGENETIVEGPAAGSGSAWPLTSPSRSGAE